MIVVIIIDLIKQQLLKYIYNSNEAIIFSSNEVSKASNHMVLLNKTMYYKQMI